MKIRRVVNTDFWTDDKVVDMFSPEDKLFFLYLLTNPHTTQLGIYPINKRIMAFEIGYSLEAITVLLDRFQTKYGIIKYSDSTGEIAIKYYLRHSIIKGGKPVEDLLRKEISQVKDRSLLEYVYQGIYTDTTINETVKGVLPCLHTMKESKNDSDNENDVSYHESYHDSYNDSSKRFTPPKLSDVSEYCSQRNNDVDPERFINFYTSKGWKVGNQPMKDWKAAVRTWEKRSNDKKAEILDYGSGTSTW